MDDELENSSPSPNVSEHAPSPPNEVQERTLAPEPPATPEDAADPLEEQLQFDIEAVTAANADLLERLRLALLASDPAIDPALVSGATAEQVEASSAAAQRTVAAIREAVRREQQARIPAGAPARATTGPRTAYDKIRAGLTRLGTN
jgi:hypothetical protein